MKIGVPLLAPALLSQRENQTDKVRIFIPLLRSGILKTSTAEASHRRIATDPGPRIVFGLDALQAIPFYIVVVEVPDDRVLVKDGWRRLRDPSGSGVNLLAVVHEDCLLFAEHRGC